ncbi:Cyclin-dependent kinase inhibitor 1-like protein [Aix galericulata]|nr:Cyclin-dependent kinase inhibitor 1-like protein [Aix galericulata]
MVQYAMRQRTCAALEAGCVTAALERAASEECQVRTCPVFPRESPLYILTREQHRGEKMERRPGKTTCARRNLFGPIDHKQLQQDFQHMLHNGAKGAQQEWNFDFLRDRPVEGLLQWEGLEGCKVPAFYSCVVGEARRPLQHLYWPLDREDNSHHFAQIALTEKPKNYMKIGAKRIPEGKKRRQTSLTGQKSQFERLADTGGSLLAC